MGQTDVNKIEPQALCDMEECPKKLKICCHHCTDKSKCLDRCNVSPNYEHCIYKEKRKRQKELKLEFVRIRCPHCGGKLSKSIFTPEYDLDCNKCGRSWEVKKEKNREIWLSYFDALQVRYERKNNRFKGLPE